MQFITVEAVKANTDLSSKHMDWAPYFAIVCNLDERILHHFIRKIAFSCNLALMKG